MCDLVFVYGTLMKGKRNHHLLKTSTFIDNGSIEGFFMFDLGTYPGVAKSKYNSKVIGEVYKVDKQTMDKLDELEEVGYLYNKEEVEVILNNGDTVNAFVYIYILKEYKEELVYKVYKY